MNLKHGAVQDAEGFAVPRAGHQVHQDQPEAVNQLIMRFLQTRVCHTALSES